MQRKLKAALAWVDRINALSELQRGGPPLHYVLLGEDVFKEWQSKGAHLAELLNFERLRPQVQSVMQQKLI